MNKKSMLAITAAFVILSVSTVTMARSVSPNIMGNGGMGCGGMVPDMQGQPPAQLIEQQQTDWKSWREKNLQLRKEYLANLVKCGVLTQKQIDDRIQAMEANYAFRGKYGYLAPGSMNGVKLTDEQKVEMKKLFEQRMSIRKDALAAYVKADKVTQVQADSQLQRMQDRFNYLLENGFNGQKGKRGMGDGSRF